MPDDAAFSLRYQLFAVITAIKIHVCYLALFLVTSIDTGTAAGCNIAFDWYRVGPLLLYNIYYYSVANGEHEPPQSGGITKFTAGGLWSRLWSRARRLL